MSDFGHPMRELWGLDPEITYLNHGTVGATPLRVLAVQRGIQDEIERQPSKFLLRELCHHGVGLERPERPRMRQAAEGVARHVGARADDLVFVDNATTGANAVLASLPLVPGDEVVVTALGYGGVTNAARYWTRRSGATVVEVPLPESMTDPAFAVEAIDGALGDRSRLLIIDLIASHSALMLPVPEIVSRCRARGVPVLVDGAHAPGAIALDIPALGADWFVGNLHKWAWAPRSSAILWVAPERQPAIHPAVISWGLDQGFTTEFDLVGTRDPSPWLASPAGLEMLDEMGAAAVRSYNHDLAYAAAGHLAGRWGTSYETPESMVATMVTVPLPERYGSQRDDAARVRDWLLFDEGIEVNVSERDGVLRVRVAIQIYNEMSDVERLADVVARR